jgi:hypothetical protein
VKTGDLVLGVERAMERRFKVEAKSFFFLDESFTASFGGKTKRLSRAYSGGFAWGDLVG